MTERESEMIRECAEKCAELRDSLERALFHMDNPINMLLKVALAMAYVRQASLTLMDVVDHQYAPQKATHETPKP